MSTLNEDLQVLQEAIETGRQSVGPHAELMAEQMRAAGISGHPLSEMGELGETVTMAVDELAAFATALGTEGTQVGQAHTESPDAARSGSYYDAD